MNISYKLLIFVVLIVEYLFATGYSHHVVFLHLYKGDILGEPALGSRDMMQGAQPKLFGIHYFKSSFILCDWIILDFYYYYYYEYK